MEMLQKYFPGLGPEQIGQFRRLEEEIRAWNRQINLISRKETDQLVERHFLHSLGIARFAAFEPGESVLDVGTGGGFPGLPLAIFYPRVSFCLIDSIGKKVKAVRAMASALGLENVECRQVRAEEFSGRADHIVSRAVSSMDRFAGWVRGRLRVHEDRPERNGLWYLKGGDLQAELGSFPEAVIYSLHDHFGEEFFTTKKLVFLPASSLAGR